MRMRATAGTTAATTRGGEGGGDSEDGRGDSEDEGDDSDGSGREGDGEGAPGLDGHGHFERGARGRRGARRPHQEPHRAGEAAGEGRSLTHLEVEPAGDALLSGEDLPLY